MDDILPSLFIPKLRLVNFSGLCCSGVPIDRGSWPVPCPIRDQKDEGRVCAGGEQPNKSNSSICVRTVLHKHPQPSMHTNSKSWALIP